MEFDFRGFQDRCLRPEDLPWDRILMIAPVVIVLAMAALAMWNSVYTVEPNEKAVVMRFGKFHPPIVEPGLRFCIPLVDTVLKVGVQERGSRLPYGTDSGRPRGAPEEEALMLTGDLNAAAVEWTIQWKVSEPDQYLFRFYREDDPKYAEKVIQTVAETVMNRLVGDYSIDEVLTEKRGELALKAREATQEILDKYSCGVRIRDLQMQRVSPPEKVRTAFDEVNASIQKKDQLENEANKERNQLLPTAYAEQDKLIKEAEGYAERRRAETEGEIAALKAKFREYRKFPEETRQRLYLEAMEEVFGTVESKVIVDTDLQGKILPLLPLDQGAKP
ncbi:MAG: FtsH protease activity modulator HflK [Planctomycetota bacterium]